MSLAREDAAACRALLATGSKSFSLAGRLLPGRTLNEAAAIYAFCRQADDAIDDAPSVALAKQAHAALQYRLFAIEHAPRVDALCDPVDRSLKRVIQQRALSVAPLHFLLDGFLWDASARTYDTVQQTLDYAARVAGSVGILMARLCGINEPCVLARAADMGVAMQLVNIARDVGEDAARGRLYLPSRWLRQENIAPGPFLQRPAHSRGLARVTERTLCLADALFSRARLALYALPWYARTSFAAAGRIYQDIGRDLRRRGHQNIARRAHVSLPRKAYLVGQALLLDGYKPRTRRNIARLSRPALAANRSLL